MKVLRHSPLTFWILAVIVLVGVLAAALTLGRDSSPMPRASSPLITHTDLVALASLRTDLGPMDLALGQPPTASSVTALHAWGQQVQQVALRAASTRRNEAGNDRVAHDFAHVATATQAAQSLAPTATGAEQWAAATAVAAAVDKLTIDTGAHRFAY